MGGEVKASPLRMQGAGGGRGSEVRPELPTNHATHLGRREGPDGVATGPAAAGTAHLLAGDEVVEGLAFLGGEGGVEAEAVLKVHGTQVRRTPTQGPRKEGP